MLFQDKLALLMSRLNCAVVEVSRTTGLDPSLVSRFRSGARIPSQESDQIVRLSNGLAEMLEDNPARGNILRGCGLPDREDLSAVLFQWFCAEDSGLGPPRRSRSHVRRTASAVARRRGELMGFADKLNALMNALEVSNVRLSRQLEVDPSLISRYRKGMRAPAPGSDVVPRIADFFAERATTDKQKAALWQCMGVRYTSDLNTDLREGLSDWLTRSMEPRDTAPLPLMDTFLDKLNSFHPQTPCTSQTPCASQPPCPVAPATLSFDSYLGSEGIRNAVVRAISAVLNAPEPVTIRLYTDLSMSWLVKDDEYRRNWHSLMQQMLNKGCNVIMIHDMGRNVGEMITSLENWLPMYMTGRVEPYFCSHTAESRFTHTLFAAEGVCSVFNSCVVGMEEQAEYRYTEDPSTVAWHSAQVEALRQASVPLMRVFSPEETQQYEQEMRTLGKLNGDVRILQPTLSNVTMPRELMESILRRSRYPDDGVQWRMELLDTRKRVLEQTVQTRITELSPLASDEMLFSGRVPVDIPGISSDIPVFYTPEEYAQHVQSLMRLLQEKPNYIFCPLPDTPFENIRILSKTSGQVMAFRSGNPSAAFLFTHPLLCQAFERYLDTLTAASEKSCQGTNLQQMLRRFIL